MRESLILSYVTFLHLVDLAQQLSKKITYKLEDCFLSSNITFEFGKKDENALKSSLFQTSSFV